MNSGRELHRARRFLLLAAAVIPLALLAAGCGGAGPAAAGGGKLNVVAAENTWGSLAAQLGGEEVAVTSIVTNPAADPHDYEPTSEDAKTLARAQISIVNGIGYDEWATKLLAANPDSSRDELAVGDVVGLGDGDNPHQWYSPTSVHEVVDAIVAAYKRALPDDSAYFDQRQRRLERDGLGEYDQLIARIRSSYAGTPVGASESVFEPLTGPLGLRLVTPKGFMAAIAEGTEPTPAEKATTDQQIGDKQIALWVYNSQNATPDVKRLNEAAEAEGIPVATLTETMTPAGASFQRWMSRELRGIAAALKRGRGG
jgi:zinc/manganese transport system substrate-binding protein